MLVSDLCLNSSNPFATRFIRPGAQTYLSPREPHESLDSESIAVLLDRLRRSHRGLIVGPHGTGKSTFIRTLQPVLTESYSSYLHVQLSRYPNYSVLATFKQKLGNVRQLFSLARQARRDGVIVLDGLEQVPWIVRWLFCVFIASRRCDLLATSHHRMRGFSELYRTELGPSLIRRLANDLIRHSDEGSIAVVQNELLRRDLDTVKNVRDLWFELYDVVGRYVETKSIRCRTEKCCNSSIVDSLTGKAD